MDHINAVIQEGDPESTLLALQRPEAQLPIVYPFAAAMYQNELFNLQKQNAMVSQRRLGYRDVNSESSQRGVLLRKGEWESSVLSLAQSLVSLAPLCRFHTTFLSNSCLSSP